MKAVILAAGKGDNLKPFTDTRPNPMISVAGKYLFDHSLDLLRKAGINDIFVVVGHQKEKLVEQIGEHVYNGLNLQYVEQTRAGGLDLPAAVQRNVRQCVSQRQHEHHQNH